MTLGTFVLAGRVLDKTTSRPVRNTVLVLTDNTQSVGDPDAHAVYTRPPSVMTDNQGNLCLNLGDYRNPIPDAETGITLVVGPQYTVRHTSPSVLPPLTFDSPPAGTTLYLESVVAALPDVPPTWAQSMTQERLDRAAGDAATLAAAKSYTDQHSSSFDPTPIYDAVSTEQARAIAAEQANTAAITDHTARTDNPHAVTKAQVGLSNVNNTADSAKPVSAAQQAALDAKLPLAGGTLTGLLTLAGDPTAPLHAATRQYVLAVRDALVNGAPGLLDTLGEIAAQMANDESAVAALTTAVNARLVAANNLSDVPSPATARNNLGLASAAQQPSSAFDPAGAAVALGTANNPITDPAAARPVGIPSVWWRTSTPPTNLAAGDRWVNVREVA